MWLFSQRLYDTHLSIWLLMIANSANGTMNMNTKEWQLEKIRKGKIGIGTKDFFFFSLMRWYEKKPTLQQTYKQTTTTKKTKTRKKKTKKTPSFKKIADELYDNVKGTSGG